MSGVFLEDGLRRGAAETETPVRINRAGSMLTLFFTSEPVTDFASAKRSDTKRYAAFFRGMLARGVFLPPSQFEAMFVSARPHGRRDRRDDRGGGASRSPRSASRGAPMLSVSRAGGILLCDPRPNICISE